ncbi:MAG: hypothetical protein R2776_02350 [Flavobacteriaceae bacterium]|nr:hypothetical protein [Flavobacteriaceae bacterium]
MKNQLHNQNPLQMHVSSVLIISISIILVYACYYSLQFTWDYFVQQASFEINNWASQPITSLY